MFFAATKIGSEVSVEYHVETKTVTTVSNQASTVKFYNMERNEDEKKLRNELLLGFSDCLDRFFLGA